MKQSGRQRAYQQLREDIVEWRLMPGTPLSEVELAQRLGVSRTPLREAIQQLAHEGLVKTSHRRGAVVADVTLDDVVKLFQMREALETYAAQLCARRPERSQFEALRDELERVQREFERSQVDEFSGYFELITRFDDAVDEATNNSYLQSALADLRGHLYRLRRIAGRHSDRMEQANREHLAICTAICDGDEVEAASATRVHIHNSLRHILNTLMEDAVGSPVFSSDRSPSLADTDRPATQ